MHLRSRPPPSRPDFGFADLVLWIQALGISSEERPHPGPARAAAERPGSRALYGGAVNHVVEGPDLDGILDRVPRDGITSLFFPPTVWVGLANHPGFASADLSSLRKAY